MRDSPDHDSSHALAAREIRFHFEGIGIIVRDPLIIIKGQDLDCRIFIENWFVSSSCNYISDLRAEKDTDFATTRAFVGARLECTARGKAAWAGGCKGSAVESCSEGYLIGGDVIPPEKVHSFRDLGQVGMCVEVSTKPLVS